MKTKPKQRSCREFSEKLANILSGYVSELSPEEQEPKVKAFEKAVDNACQRRTSPREEVTPNE
jgi:hypothetical protein